MREYFTTGVQYVSQQLFVTGPKVHCLDSIGRNLRQKEVGHNTVLFVVGDPPASAVNNEDAHRGPNFQRILRDQVRKCYFYRFDAELPNFQDIMNKEGRENYV